MTDTADVAYMGELAEASCADLHLSNDPAAELQNANFGAGQSFSVTQATGSVRRWGVVHHLPDTGSEFSATIFQSESNGKYTLAIRGTAGGGGLVLTQESLLAMVLPGNRSSPG